MRLPRQLRRSLALLCVAASAAPAQIVGANADSIPNDSWVDIYFRRFDPAAKAAGLTPLRETTLRTGEREVRIWTQVELGEPKHLYRFSDGRGTLQGELIHYWRVASVALEDPQETHHEGMLRRFGSACERAAKSSEMGTCRARFQRQPPWSRVLRQTEALDLWTLPDPSTLPPDNRLSLDGWSMVVELRDGSRYRTYRYHNPWSHPAWPSAAQARKIARALNAIDSVRVPLDAHRVYRGVTAGTYQSAFRSCDGGGEWEFHSDLRSLLEHAPPSVRAATPALADTTSRDTTLYEVEVLGELGSEWLARQWESKFPRVLQVLELRAVRPAPASGCSRRRAR